MLFVVVIINKESQKNGKITRICELFSVGRNSDRKLSKTNTSPQGAS
jgi:hypothetical protein